jgi:hypothetical protein
LDLTENLEMFGKALDAGTMGAAPLAPAEYIRRARHWIDRNKENLAQKICSDGLISVCRRFPERKLTLATAILDLTCGTYGVIVATHIGVILTLEGVELLCSQNLQSN